MRRSKVQRQEARRERRVKTLGRRGPKEEREAPQMFTVVRTDDARQGKYLWCGHEGIALDHAERLAAPVPGQQQSYTVVPVEVHRWARAQGKPIGAQEAVAAYVPDEEAA